METHLNLTITDQCQYWLCFQKSMRDYFIIETVSPEGTFCDTVQVPSRGGDMELI